MSNKDIKYTLLVAEDEVIVALDLQTKLRSLGYHVPFVVSKGEDVLTKIPEVKPDIILLDIMLKGQLDGIDTAKQIKEKYRIPIIYLTAYADEKTLKRAKITDPFGYILKPFAERDLRTTIEMATYRYKIQRELEENQEWLSTTLDSIGDGVIATDADGMIKFINLVAQKLLLLKSEKVEGKHIDSIFHIQNAETLETITNPIFSAIEKKVVSKLIQENILVLKNGKTIFIDQNAAPILNHSDNIIGAVLVFRDVSTRRRIEQDLKKSHSRFQSLVNSNFLGIIVADYKGRVKEVNNVFLKMIGYTRNEFETNKVDWSKMSPPEYLHVDEIASKELFKNGYCMPFEKEYMRKDGSKIPVLIGLTRLEGSEDEAVCFVIDLTENKLEDKEIYKLAYIDQLTGLPNRAKFIEIINSKITHYEKGKNFAILFMDLNNFKSNPIFIDHNIRDSYIKKIGEILVNVVGKNHVVCHPESDEFMILLNNVNDQKEIDTVCIKLMSKLSAQINTYNLNYKISLNIGIALYPLNDEKINCLADDLILQACLAMYKSKKIKDNSYFYFNNLKSE